jgi:hypothetical protein
MKPAFKLPDRQRVDDWVASGGGEGVQPPKSKPARLTIDLPAKLHARFKSACALNSTDMVTEVRSFIEAWTQKHSNP